METSPLPLISVVIVNFNAGDWLLDCVVSVLQSEVPLEVWVSDNGSMDDSLKKLRRKLPLEPRLRIHKNYANLGFARGNNAVLPRVSGEYVLLLNPDCRVQPDTLQAMCAAMAARPEAGIAGCLVRNTDGSLQRSSRRFIPTPQRSLVRVLALDRIFPRCQGVDDRSPLPIEPTFVEGTSGAFMFVRRAALQQVGGLDEGYFLHCDDLDWFMRFGQAGWKILFVPCAEVTHVQGACGKRTSPRVVWHKHCGMWRFYRKFFYSQHSVLFAGAVWTGIWTRFFMLSIFGWAVRHRRRSGDLG